MQSKLQSTISSPREQGSTARFIKIRTTAQLSHPLLPVSGHLVARATLHQGQTQGVTNDTLLLQLSQVNHLLLTENIN